VGQITTSSPEALKYFSEGSKCYWIGENRKAIQFFEKAITLDPEFALAYRYMGGAYANLGYTTKYSEYRQKAFELSNRVSDRERYRIQGDFYRRSEKTYEKAFEAFDKLLELYPDDWLGNNSLGVLYETLEEWNKAKERYEVNVGNKVEVMFSYANLARIYGYMGLYDKAREVLEFYINNITDNARIRRGLAENYLRHGKYELALSEAEIAFSLNPTTYNNILLKGDIFHLKGDLDKAEEEYQKLMMENETIALSWSFMRLSSLYLLKGRFEESKKQLKLIVELTEKAGEKTGERYIRNLLAYIHTKTGNPEESLKELDKALRSAVEAEDLGMQRNVLYNRAHAYIEMETIDQALKTADELKDLIEKAPNKKLMRQYHDLMGMIESRKENFLKAIEYFKRAMSLLPYYQASSHPLYIDHLALAYYSSRDLENAREEYAKIALITTGRLDYGDIYAKSFYMLGKIYEEQGNSAKAIEHYEKFLNLWKDADPGIAEVDDARERLAEL
jgi:tetratricopeptide (TPR) repeat protein